MSFNALLATRTGDTIASGVVPLTEQDLMPGDVTVAVEYSTARGRTPEDADTRSGRCWQPRLQPCWGSKRSHVDFTDRRG